jgi:hypothetical protein
MGEQREERGGEREAESGGSTIEDGRADCHLAVGGCWHVVSTSNWP